MCKELSKARAAPNQKTKSERIYIKVKIIYSGGITSFPIIILNIKDNKKFG